MLTSRRESLMQLNRRFANERVSVFEYLEESSENTSEQMLELYSEILYGIEHAAGCDVKEKKERDVLLQYLQEVFKMDSQKHSLLLEKTKTRKAPNIFLRAEIIEAKGIKPKDPNGLSDPFCTLYLSSDSSKQFNTSVKPETLNPIWEESFLLPIISPDEDVLNIEVWDFDPEETTREKMKRIKEVKGMKGIKILMKEVASSGKNNNDLVGVINLPLNCVPAGGKTIWCTMHKNGKLKKQGQVKVHLSFVFDKNTKVAYEEYKHLLYVTLMHEVQQLKEGSPEWNGELSNLADTILTQHRVQCGLPSISVTLAQWIEYINVHVLHPLDFNVFVPLLEKLAKTLQEQSLNDEQVMAFWEAAKKLLTSCIISIKKLQIDISFNNASDQSSQILSILSLLTTLQSPKGVDLFPIIVYDWLPMREDSGCDIKAVVKETVLQGSRDWFTFALERNKLNDASVADEKLNKLSSIVDQAILSLKSASDSHDKIFQEHFHFPYTKELYKVYESKLAEIVEPIVTCETTAMKPVKFSEDMMDGPHDNEAMKKGTSLFQLYHNLQQFSGIGKSLFPEGENVSQNFYLWFYPATLQWLYISHYKALQAIQKAVNLDHLIPVDDTVDYSSSAVDILQIFEQIRIFWKSLAWPDGEAAFTFATNMIYDICRCSAFYTDKISEKVERICENSERHGKRFHLTEEWYMAVRNIDHVKNSIRSCVTEFGLEEIISSFIKSGNADTCRNTIQGITDSGINIVSKNKYKVLERATRKMAPTINMLIMEVNKDKVTKDELMKYLDDTLRELHTNLSSDNFKYILYTIWDNLLNTLFQQMNANLRVTRDPSFYKKELHIFNTLVEFFRECDEFTFSINLTTIQKIEEVLMFNSLDAPELIHHYYLERKEEQRAMTAPVYGLITVRMQLVDNALNIEILNARNLQPLKNKDTCDSYVKVSLLPEQNFPGIANMTTKVHRDSKFPLFDEKFTTHLAPEQANLWNGLIMFEIREKYLLSEDKYLGEAYASFTDIVRTDSTVKFDSTQQLHLKINRPTNAGCEAFKALSKHEDRLAQEFVKRRKHMFPAP